MDTHEHRTESLRTNVRAVLLSPAETVLLMKLQEPRSRSEFWITPGGRAKDGEDHPTALLRELWEETGRRQFGVGPLVWTRNHTYEWDGRIVAQQEYYYLVETEEFPARMRANPGSGEVKAFRAFRWWTVEEIRTAAESFGPAGLAGYLEELIQAGPGSQPVDIGR